MLQNQLVIEPWTAEHPNWGALATLVDELGQTEWVAFQADWHLSWHMLVARLADKPVGFLYYVTQAIGVEEDRPAVTVNGKPLTESKVIAFGVAATHRRQGIGRLLQTRLIAESRAQGCHQIRSHSGDENVANHQLKLAMGFAMHPLVPGQGKDGVYFLLPLNGKG